MFHLLEGIVLNKKEMNMKNTIYNMGLENNSYLLYSNSLLIMGWSTRLEGR